MTDDFATLTPDEPPPPITPTPIPPALPPALPPKVLYRVDSSRATFGELWRDTRSPAVVIAWISKLLRVRLPGSVNDPNVETLAPFEVSEASLPPDVSRRIESPLRELRELGFEPVAVHDIDDLFNQSRTHVATLARGDGSAVGRVWHRREAGGSKTHFYSDFLTAFGDGSFVWTTAARSVMEAPPHVHVTSHPDAPPEPLWRQHQAAVQRRAAASGAQPVTAAGREPALDLIERHHAAVRDFHLSRQVFRPMRDADRQRAGELEAHVDTARAAGVAHPEVWAELVRMQQRKSSFGAGALLLLVSLALFVGIGAARWDWEFVVLIVVLLLFHELGHFAAMKIFRYRNVRMFFIPLLGAAVSGVNYSAPGWKKVVVALAGPLPGILLGAVAGAAGVAMKNELLTKVGIFALVLNGFNLLPVLPLDGGRVMHTLFFARHWVLDVVFRVGACVALFAGSYAFGDRVLMFIGIFMLVGIPGSYKLARVADDLRRAGIRRATPDEKMIPPDVADQIVARVRQAFPAAMSSRVAAQHTLNVYETVNTRTPGWLATTAFTAVHAGAVLFVVLAAVGLFVAQRGGIGTAFDFRGASALTRPPKYALAVEQIQVVAAEPADVVAPTTAPATVVATFATPADAAKAFAEVGSGGARPAALFGQSIMMPVGDRAVRQRWFDELDRRAGKEGDVFVASKSSGSLSLDGVAPDATAAAAIAEEAREYLAVPQELHLIPPWSPAYERGRRDAWRRARQTYHKLQRAAAVVPPDSTEIRDLEARAADLRRRGESEELEKLGAQQEALYQRLRAEGRRKALNGADPSMDLELGRAYLKLVEEFERSEAAGIANGDIDSAMANHARMLQAFARDLGPRMGQIELGPDGKPAKRSDRFSSESGGVTSDGETVRFRWVQLVDPATGAPALARWLAEQQNCRDLRYEFNMMPGYVGDAFDTDE